MRVCLAVCQVLPFDITGWEVMISLNDDGLVAFGKQRVIPLCACSHAFDNAPGWSFLPSCATWLSWVTHLLWFLSPIVSAPRGARRGSSVRANPACLTCQSTVE